jgi:hypothetical protein
MEIIIVKFSYQLKLVPLIIHPFYNGPNHCLNIFNAVGIIYIITSTMHIVNSSLISVIAVAAAKFQHAIFSQLIL